MSLQYMSIALVESISLWGFVPRRHLVGVYFDHVTATVSRGDAGERMSLAQYCEQ